MTIEQKFAKEMSDLVYDKWTKSKYFNQTVNKVSDVFANNIIDNPKHSMIIRGIMYDTILADVTANPNAFEKEDKNMEFRYSPEVFEYGKHVNSYIADLYEKERWQRIKTKYKVWIEIERIEYDPKTEDEEYFDEDNPIAVAYRDNIEEALTLQNDIVNAFNEL